MLFLLTFLLFDNRRAGLVNVFGRRNQSDVFEFLVLYDEVL